MLERGDPFLHVPIRTATLYLAEVPLSVPDIGGWTEESNEPEPPLGPWVASSTAPHGDGVKYDDSVETQAEPQSRDFASSTFLSRR